MDPQHLARCVLWGEVLLLAESEPGWADAAAREVACARRWAKDAASLAERSRRLVLGEPGPPGPLPPLRSVLSLVSTDPNTPARAATWYRPAALGEAIPYPLATQPPDAAAARRGMATAFAADLAALAEHATVNALLALLERYGSLLPARYGPDRPGPEAVSFYDQARLTQAVALCLNATGGEERFHLVGGDLSGVQRFIYTISSKGALKSLRGRSFYLELLLQATIDRLLAALHLTRANVVYVAGGNFYLLAPGLPAVTHQVGMVADDLNHWLLDEFGGSLFLALESVTLEAADLLASAKPWGELARLLGGAKGRKFAARGSEASFWGPWEPAEPCGVCHREDRQRTLARLADPEPGEEPVLACGTCRELYRLGERLPKARALVPVVGGAQGVPAGRSLRYRAGEPGGASDAGPVYLLMGGTPDPRALSAEGCEPLTVAQYVTLDPGGHGAATFEELAKRSTGKHRLGVLRLDVDRLGTLFSRGLGDEHSLARLAALSEQIGRFFRVGLPAICRGQPGAGMTPLRMPAGRPLPAEGRPVTVVYAGGDDAFVVGAWDAVCELAFDIHAAWQRYTGGHLTLSAGVAVADWHLPLYHLAEQAGEAEQAAKDAGRDAVALLYEGPGPLRQGSGSTVPAAGPPLASRWEEAHRALGGLLKPLLEEMGSWEQGKVRLLAPRGVLYRLAVVVRRWQQDGVLYQIPLAWLSGRTAEHLPEGLQEPWRRWCARLWEADAMRQLPWVLRWVELLTGEEETRERTKANER